MKKIAFALLLLFPLLAGAQALDTLAAKKSLDSLIRISALHYVAGRYTAAREASKGIIALAERLHSRQSGEAALGLNNLALAEMNLGDLDLAILYMEEALAIRLSIFGRKNAMVGATMNSLGVLYTRVGRLAEAEACLLEFKAGLEERLGANHPDIRYALISLAKLYEAMGQYRNAEDCLLKVKDVWATANGRENAHYALIINELGNLVLSLGRFDKAEQYFLEVKNIQEKVLKPDHPDYAICLNNLGSFYNATGHYGEAIPLLEQALQIFGNSKDSYKAFYTSVLNTLANAYAGMGNISKAEELLIESLKRIENVPDKAPLDYAIELNNLAKLYLHKNLNGATKADSLFKLAETIVAGSIGRHTWEYLTILTNHALFCQAVGMHAVCDSLMLEARKEEYDMLIKATQFLSEEELSRYIARFSDQSRQPFYVAVQRKTASGLLPDLCFNNALFYKGFVQEAVSLIRHQVHSDSTTTKQYESLAGLRRRLAQEYGRSPAKRDTAFIRYAEPRANALEKEISRKVSGYTEAYRIVRSQDVRNSLAAGEAALEFVSFTYFDLLGKPTDSTLYAALVLLPTDTTPHFIPLFEERQLQALFNRPGYNEELIVKSLYASNSKLLNLLWKPLEPLLRDVKTIYYSPAGLLHRINPAALRDADKQPLSAGRQWVRVGSTRELVTGRLADRSFAHNPAAPPTAAVWGGIPYDMDSLAFAAANPMTDAGSTTEYGSKDGNFRYMVEANTSGPSAGTRGASDDGWESLAGSAREAEQVDELLRHAGFHTEVRSGYNASEERFKAIGQAAPSPRILHVATHGFVYPDPRSGAKAPSFRRGLGEVEPAYKLQDDPMLRSGLLLAGANYYWTNKRPLANREDGVLVAYEVRDLNLSNTELAVLSACQTGLGDVVGSEGVYGLQRAFRIARARFLIVSLWQVPDTQTQELMRLFYENWVDKREPLRDAFNHAQATLREQEPNPYMWAGFVLIE